MSCFSFIFSRTQSSDKEATEIAGGIEKLKIYAYKELRDATNDFRSDHKIGEGGFGSVYKGRLKDGRMAAIKVLSSESRQGLREFLSEITAISDITHENLVELYGSCVERHNRILVYNYLENNSLAQILIGRGHNSRNIEFSWQARAKICIGVARGLAFLHEEVKPHIVHRDIKASNILLDRDLNPKISDFGLAKLIPEDVTHVSTRIAGTVGYLAPEYAVGGHLTRKADIYSYGVLLLEIVSGQSNTNSKLNTDCCYLLEKTWTLYESNELESIVDTSLAGNYDPEEACKFLKIGLLCTQDYAKLRPSMSKVVKMLTGKKDVNTETITKPGLISDFMDLKIRPSKLKSKETSSSNTTSSCPDNSNVDSIIPSITFTAISQRDDEDINN